ncbi:MAG: ACP S-malonyltransferase [Desulfobacteraceae bacterium]|nr:ACP S-malonyltransferase [Desulfobacteraceae bacterium]
MKAFIFPGQGSQAKGMAKNLLDNYPEYENQADEILGYSIRELCTIDPDHNLNNTEYTQPALFVVNALTYLDALDKGMASPDYAAGHSLGEYNALFAAGVMDFQTGLKLVQKRGKLMAQAQNGGMAAVIGMDQETIKEVIEKNGFHQINIANLNSPSQVVISGDKSQIQSAKSFFEADGTTRYAVLNVSGAFHSNLMADAGRQFEIYLEQFTFLPPQIPVISNVLARPYPGNNIKKLLLQQLTHPVKWMESICYLWGKGVDDFIETGPGSVLTKLVKSIKQDAQPLLIQETEQIEPLTSIVDGSFDNAFNITPTSLGCSEYKKDYNLKYAYAAGGMFHGIASKELVVKMGRSGMIGYFGTGALSKEEIEKAILYIQTRLDQGQAYGMNLLSGPWENEKVDLFLKHKVRNIEAAAYLQMTKALVKYKLNGLKRNKDGTIRISNRIMAKLSRPEVAQGFLSPAPADIVEKLLEQGMVTTEQAELALHLPMADDICVEADSGGHTDMGVASALMPAIIHLRDEMIKEYHYVKKIRIGTAGGIGTPEGAASAFILGADFILTGSINQCTVEAGTSDLVKDLLQEMNVQDTAYAPAGDMFEMGSKVQVLKRGVFFPARANKLYELYRHYNSLDEIDDDTRQQIENKYFKRSFDSIWEECKRFYPQAEIQRANNNPKQKMAFIFRWYFNHANLMALQGNEENRVDFQINCGPALGAFNQWVKGTNLEKWQNRHVDEIGEKLLSETCELLVKRLKQFAKKN